MSLAVSKEDQKKASEYAIKPKPKYVMFMSKRCKNCMKLHDLIAQQLEFYNLVNFVEIESQKGRLPPEVTSVPAIYDGQKVHIGNGALQWFKDASLDHLDSCFVGGNNSLMSDKYSFIGPREELFNGWSTLDAVNGTNVKDGGGGQPGQPGISSQEQPKSQISSSMEQLIEQRRQEISKQ